MKSQQKVWLVQQGVWDMALESMPLAVGYLKAAAMADEQIRSAYDVKIFNFKGGLGLSTMADALFAGAVPDVLACSVLGWNFRIFGALAETYKMIKPDGLVIFGGTHVANQAERVFRMFPEVDVVVNGEGEFTFVDLLHAHQSGHFAAALHDIAGISFLDSGKHLVTTPARPRIENLDIIPSPFLSGAIELTDSNGEFRYDVALMETNRGCPYKCAFCYWGGAVGQRVRAFSRQRLRDELEMFGKLKVHTIVLCDANFGMLPIDEEFVDDLISVRDALGFPRALETSWAKNKSQVFYRIVQKMREAGMRSSFTLALQTLDTQALDLMNRRNMKVNDWEDLVQWLAQEGLDCYAELIWGAPGETVESFLAGYDRLANHVSRIAAYPLLLLPNTDYADNKEKYGLVTVRGDADDFEYLISHNTISAQDNRFMHRILFWSRLVAENMVFRHVWKPLRVLGGISQSQVLRLLDEWFTGTDDPAAVPLTSCIARSMVDPDALAPALQYAFGHPDSEAVFRRWWSEAIRPRLPLDVADLLDEVFRFDLLTWPAYRQGGAPAAERLPVVDVKGETFYVRENVRLAVDVPALNAALSRGEPHQPAVGELVSSIYYKTGFERFVGSTNHEESLYFMGRMEAEVLAGAPLPGPMSATC